MLRGCVALKGWCVVASVLALGGWEASGRVVEAWVGCVAVKLQCECQGPCANAHDSADPFQMHEIILLFVVPSCY